MSGTLESSVPLNQFTLTGDTALAEFWVFHHGHAEAHAGVYFQGRTRVWLHTPPAGEAAPSSMSEREALRNARNR